MFNNIKYILNIEDEELPPPPAVPQQQNEIPVIQVNNKTVSSTPPTSKASKTFGLNR